MVVAGVLRRSHWPAHASHTGAHPCTGTARWQGELGVRAWTPKAGLNAESGFMLCASILWLLFRPISTCKRTDMACSKHMRLA